MQHNETAANYPAEQLAMQFSGSGSEYFRIWIVNLLLSVLSLGIYYPWAKVRKLRYFYSNTQIGADPLDFHGDPKTMLKGYLLIAALFFCYSLAGQFSPTAKLIAMLCIAGLWPMLMRSSMRFRLANSSWRGLRFRFAGSVPDAYRAVLPLFAPAALFLAVGVLFARGAVQQTWLPFAFGGLALLALLLGPRLLWSLKHYQHSHYGLGQEQTQFSATPMRFYGLCLKTLGMYLGLGLVAVIVLGGTMSIGMAQISPEARRDMSGQNLAASLFIMPVAIFVFAGINSYWVARTQNLVWNHTASQHVQFVSALRFHTLLGLSLKNWLFMVLTLGLYWPFAAVAIQRLRVQAMHVQLHMAPAELLSQAADGDREAEGDAAGDFFGFDIGL